MNRMLPTIAALLIVAGSYDAEVAIARADYNARYAAGENPRYLTTANLTREKRELAVVGMCYGIPHLTLNEVLEHQIPVQLGETSMWRIDLDLLGWGRKAWIELNKENPYIREHWHDPLIVRADWFLNITSDASDSQAYYTLLYAKTGTPKNKADWLKIHNINAVDLKGRTAVIIDKKRSGVSKDRRLMAEARDGDHWETFDSENASFRHDPNENLEGGLQFDAQELIKRLKKVSLKTGERTFVQAYLLTNGQGVRIDEANTNIVEDYTSFRGESSVRTPGGCMSCHLPLNGAVHNSLRDRRAAGVEILSNNPEFVEKTYFSKHAKLIERSREDFETFTLLACGIKSPAICLSAWRTTVEDYDENVTLDQAARDVYAVTADELKHAMGYYSETVGPQDGFAGFADLPSGFTVTRETWEGDRKKHQLGLYHFARAALDLWRAKK